MTNCAVPEDSFSSLLDLMGVGGVRSFTFAEGRGSIQSFHLQGLSALSHLGNYPLPCQYFCFASGLPSEDFYIYLHNSLFIMYSAHYHCKNRLAIFTKLSLAGNN
jgi:hypothetical protein